MKVSVLEAKDRLPELIEAAQAGEEVVISGQRETSVRLVLVPVPAAVPEGEHPVGSAERILAWHRSRRAPDWVQRTPEEIENGIKSERESWD